MPVMDFMLHCYRKKKYGPVKFMVLTPMYAVSPNFGAKQYRMYNNKGIVIIPYSDHSCHDELVEFITLVQPKSIVPVFYPLDCDTIPDKFKGINNNIIVPQKIYDMLEKRDFSSASSSRPEEFFSCNEVITNVELSSSLSSDEDKVELVQKSCDRVVNSKCEDTDDSSVHIIQPNDSNENLLEKLGIDFPEGDLAENASNEAASSKRKESPASSLGSSDSTGSNKRNLPLRRKRFKKTRLSSPSTLLKKRIEKESNSSDTMDLTDCNYEKIQSFMCTRKSVENIVSQEANSQNNQDNLSKQIAELFGKDGVNEDMDVIKGGSEEANSSPISISLLQITQTKDVDICNAAGNTRTCFCSLQPTVPDKLNFWIKKGITGAIFKDEAFLSSLNSL